MFAPWSILLSKIDFNPALQDISLLTTGSSRNGCRFFLTLL
ncbi:hypothetical protein AtDm6_2579 [Acetobacter tropicalis]|uniref:Uncharacterized protein n=1 Tax=Acetobacter tropicalis TaxID=104102 RepID=A0A094ZHT1_9PROT|nr:hypothetical protein AtDm6_2579 [Acetobacter tropicalis]